MRIRQGVGLGRCLCRPLACLRLAALLRLQVITLEGWVEIMYYVMDAHSFYNFIYFILLIIVSVRGAGASGHAQGPMHQGWGWGSPGSRTEPGELSGREQGG